MQQRIIHTSLVAATLLLLAGSGHAAKTKVRCRPLKYFIPRHRIVVTAKIKDDVGVKLARCYFRASEGKQFFVPMRSGSKNTFTGLIPAPDQSTSSLSYLFLPQNNMGEVFRTQEFSVFQKNKKNAPSWQTPLTKQNISVFAEEPSEALSVPGFADQFAPEVITEQGRLMSSANPITAGTANVALWSTVGAVGGVALIGGTAAALGNSGGGGGGGGVATNTPSGTVTQTLQNVVGIWNAQLTDTAGTNSTAQLFITKQTGTAIEGTFTSPDIEFGAIGKELTGTVSIGSISIKLTWGVIFPFSTWVFL